MGTIICITAKILYVHGNYHMYYCKNFVFPSGAKLKVVRRNEKNVHVLYWWYEHQWRRICLDTDNLLHACIQNMYCKHIKSPKIVPNSHNFTLPALVLTGLADLGLATLAMNAHFIHQHI